VSRVHVGDCLANSVSSHTGMLSSAMRRRVVLTPRPCEACGRNWTPKNSTQARRNRACSRKCTGVLISRAPRQRQPDPVCRRCHVPFRPKSKARVENPAEVERLRAIAGEGHKGWTAQGRKPWVARMTGAGNPAWKGGVMMLNGHGLYMGARYTLAPPHLRCMARKDGWIMEHRLVVALWCGRPLTRLEVVHHVDHNPRNNVRSNLELWPDNSTHKRMEHGRFCEGACNAIGVRP
jgi:hypothetical protein